MKLRVCSICFRKWPPTKYKLYWVAGWSSAGGEPAGSKQEQIPSQQQPSVVWQWPWDTNPGPPAIVCINMLLFLLFVGETRRNVSEEQPRTELLKLGSVSTHAAGVWTYETRTIKGGRRSSSADQTPFFTLKIEGKKLAITILGVSQRSATFVRKSQTSSAT